MLLITHQENITISQRSGAKFDGFEKYFRELYFHVASLNGWFSFLYQQSDCF